MRLVLDQICPLLFIIVHNQTTTEMWANPCYLKLHSAHYIFHRADHSLWQKHFNWVMCHKVYPLISGLFFGSALWSNARLITYFRNFDFSFSSLRFPDFMYNDFCLQGKMGKLKWKINKLLVNILVTSSPKQPKMKLAKWDESFLTALFKSLSF